MIWLKKENDWCIQLTKVSILFCWWIMMVQETMAAIHYAFPLCPKQNSAFCSIHWDFVFFDFVWKVLYAECAAKQKKSPALRCKTGVNYCLPAHSPAGLWMCKPKQLAQASFFLAPLVFWAESGLLLLAFSHQRYKHCCLCAVRSRCFSLCIMEGPSYGEIEMFLRTATCHKGRKNYICWSMLLILIYFVCMK